MFFFFKFKSVNTQNYSLEYNCQSFKTGQIRRHFVQVPLGSNIAGLFIYIL
jgi:hypothetical protein